MHKKYVLREEPFGYTFFDKKELKHKFLLPTEVKSWYKNNNILEKDVEFLKARNSSFRNDIIYSPIRVYFEITLACNLKCRYCYNSSGIPRKEELSKREIFKVLDDFKKQNVLDIRFTGGEPTCRKDWFDIMSYAKKLGFAVSCNTNAAYVDEDINKKFAKLDIEQVTVSLDGDKKNHERNRGKNTFDRTILNLKKMHDLGVNLRINTLINKYSINDIEFVLNIASKYVQEINFFTIVFLGRGFHSENEDGVTIEENLKISEKIELLKQKYKNLKILHFAEVSRTTSVDVESQSKFLLKVGPPSGFTTFNVISNGDYACGGYSPYISDKFLLGNVKKWGIFETWQRNKKLEKIRDDSERLVLFCNKCKKFQNKECQGSKYETELIRLLNPGVKNPNCIFGDGPSLIKLSLFD